MPKKKKKKKKVDPKQQRLDDLKVSFNTFDKDRDGAISFKEMKQGLFELGLTPSNEEVHDVIVQFDRSKSGTIYFDEFVEFMSRRVAGVNIEEEMRGAFDVVDFGGKGFVTVDDLKMFLLSCGESFSLDQLSEIIKEHDIDNSNQLNYEEFVNLVFKTL